MGPFSNGSLPNLRRHQLFRCCRQKQSDGFVAMTTKHDPWLERKVRVVPNWWRWSRLGEPNRHGRPSRTLVDRQVSLLLASVFHCVWTHMYQLWLDRWRSCQSSSVVRLGAPASSNRICFLVNGVGYSQTPSHLSHDYSGQPLLAENGVMF